MLIEPFFKDFDTKNNLHVSRCQMRRAFSSNSIILCDKEIQALMARYGNDCGFNYMKFLKDINEVQFCESKHKKLMEMLKKINKPVEIPCQNPNVTIVDVLAKIRGQIVRKRINFDRFLRNGEKFNNPALPASDFERNFSAAGIFLEKCELDILTESCRMPTKPDCVNVKDFCELINQVFYHTKLEKQPCKSTIQHLPTHDGALNFLNFEERFVVSRALQKLSRYPDDISNVGLFLNEYSGKSGCVTRNNLERALNTCGLVELLTHRELDILFKCFLIERGGCKMFDYKNFLMITSNLHSIK